MKNLSLLCLLITTIACSHAKAPKEGEEIITKDKTMVYKLDRHSRLVIGKNSQVKVGKNSFQLKSGYLRLGSVGVERSVECEDVTYSTQQGNKADFEVSVIEEGSDLDVQKGEVLVRSPHIQTFVPEIVKSKEGHRYVKAARQFQRRAFKSKF